MKIPQVREEILLIREALKEHATMTIALCDRLSYLVSELERRPPVRRAPSVSAKVTPELQIKIKEYAEAHPAASFAGIAKVFNVNSGRVSEVIRGKRK